MGTLRPTLRRDGPPDSPCDSCCEHRATTGHAECRAFPVAYVHADHRTVSAPMGGSVRFPDADSRAPATTSATSQRRLIMLHIDRGVSRALWSTRRQAIAGE